MKKTTSSLIALSLLFSLILISCNDNDKRKEMEDRENAKVGKVYDREQQGIEHENRENQFPSSRNDSGKGTGQETGAPSDTTAAKEITPQSQTH